MSTEPTRRALFLHGGPGGHCHVERAWFGDALPIDWWDQPTLAAGAARGHTLVVEAAEARLRALADAQGGPVHVIGFSAGARVALSLVERAPEAVSELTLLAPQLFVPRGLLRLARRLADGPPEPWRAALGDAARGVEAGLSPRTLEGLVAALLGVPDLGARYWGPTSGPAAERYRALLADRPFVDLDTFRAVALELIEDPAPPTRLDAPRRVRVLAGRHDPLFDAAEEQAHLRASLPGAAVELLPCGHWVHLETDPAVWLGRA